MTAYHPILPFISRLKIVDKDVQTRVLGRVINPAQMKLVTAVEEDIRVGRPIRHIVLKARQVGFSTAIEAMAYQWSFCQPRNRGLVISHRSDSVEHLLSMTEHYWSTWWAQSLYRATSQARDKMAWEPTGSKLSVLTAKSAEAARSRTFQFVHASEAAFWEDAGTLMRGLQVPKRALTAIFIESTANGIGNWYHEMWEAAKNGDVAYTPHFFPWWQHPEYNAEWIGRGDDARKLSLARLGSGGHLDDEEWQLYRMLSIRGMDDAEIRSRLMWRRFQIADDFAGDLDGFHQEYPATDDEAFLSTGRNVFHLSYLRAAYDPVIPDVGKLVYDSTALPSKVRFIPDPSGPLSVYEYPAHSNPSQWYLIGIDNSKATQFGDYSVGQVIKRDSLEQVATWRQRGMNEVMFAEQMMLLGRWYNTAMLAPEYNMNGAGINAIVEQQYPSYYVHRKAGKLRGVHDGIVGWPMTEQTKNECVSMLHREVFAAYERRSNFAIHDEPTYFEMKNYIINDKGKYENSKNAAHDDTVTSLAIAVAAASYERPSMAKQQVRVGKASVPAAVAAGIMAVGESQGAPVGLAATRGHGVDVEGVEDEGDGVSSRSREHGRDGDRPRHSLVLPPELNPFAERDVDMYSDGEY